MNAPKKMKVGDLVKLKVAPGKYEEKYVGKLGMVMRVSPGGCNLTVNLFDGGHIGLLAWSWFEVVSEAR